MSDCVFCNIVTGSDPASVVHEDDIVIAFMDIGPVNPGHVLVVPKSHFTHMADMDEETGAHLFKVCMRIERAIRKSGVRYEGTSLTLADGEAAGQDVFHLHMHGFPRFKGDSYKVNADFSAKPSREELDGLAGMLRRNYE